MSSLSVAGIAADGTEDKEDDYQYGIDVSTLDAAGSDPVRPTTSTPGAFSAEAMVSNRIWSLGVRPEAHGSSIYSLIQLYQKQNTA
jgi:hypothetical protein